MKKIPSSTPHALIRGLSRRLSRAVSRGLASFSFSACVVLFVSISLTVGGAALAEGGPKYGPNAVPLSRKSNLEYFKKTDAPDFWALMPYYTAQTLGQQCSPATFTMVLNGARTSAGVELTSADNLVTIKNLLEKYTDDRYKKAMSAAPGGGLLKLNMSRDEVSNPRLVEVLTTATGKLGLKDAKVIFTPLDVKAPEKKEEGRKAFHEALVQNEKTANDFLILSAFIQGDLTGDPEGGAHVAAIGGYDEKKKLVLIVDPDRDWYEPYWSPEEAVFRAMANPKADGKQLGWIHLKVR